MRDIEVKRYRNADFFAAEGVCSDMAMSVSANGTILGYEPDLELRTELSVDLGGQNVMPGLIDLQVNGADGQWVWSADNIGAIMAIDASLLRHGITRWCPTYISPTTKEIVTATKLSKDAIEASLGVIAWHFEGPWINVERHGAHPTERVRSLTELDLYSLQNLAKVSKVIVTLAPELVPSDIVRELSSSGVTVLAGHTNAKLDDYEKFFEAGGAGITHIGNACNLLESRQSYGWGALVHNHRKIATVIVDGHHIDSTVLTILKRSLNRNQIIAVSDLVAGPTSIEDKFNIFSSQCFRSTDGAARTGDGRLAGSLTNLFQGLRFLVQRCGIPLDEAIRMCTTYPAELLGVSSNYGSLQEGACCDMVTFSNYFVIHEVFRGGVSVFRLD